MATILLILWLIGLLTGNSFGGLIHILLVVAVIVLVTPQDRVEAALEAAETFCTTVRRPFRFVAG